MPFEVGLRKEFAEITADGAVPRSIFLFPDSSKAKQEALQFCRYVEQKVFGK